MPVRKVMVIHGVHESLAIYIEGRAVTHLERAPAKQKVELLKAQQAPVDRGLAPGRAAHIRHLPTSESHAASRRF